jgi:ABC-2 type transport system permease protein
MHLALWKKSFRDARWLLLGSCAVMVAFQWMRVWMIGQLPIGNFRNLLKWLPPLAEQLAPIPYDELATPLGRVSAGFTEPLVVLIITVWGISRGSDAVSGELGRGTMELLLAQPVRRISVLMAQAGVTLGGAALLALSAWAGMALGLKTITLEEPVEIARLIPGVLNLFCLCAFLAGVSTLASSWDRYRARTIGVMGAVYVAATILKIFGRVSPNWHWLAWFSFFTAFEPALWVMRSEGAWVFWYETANGMRPGGLAYDGLLLGLAAAAYAGAALVFCRRDLPAPL